MYKNCLHIYNIFMLAKLYMQKISAHSTIKIIYSDIYHCEPVKGVFFKNCIHGFVLVDIDCQRCFLIQYHTYCLPNKSNNSFSVCLKQCFTEKVTNHATGEVRYKLGCQRKAVCRNVRMNK